MNTKQAIAAAVITLVGSAAFAQSEVELQHFGANQASTVSRAEVRADVQRARLAGELNSPTVVLAAATAPKAGATVNTVTRAQVRGEAIQSLAELSVPTEVAMNQAPASTLSRQDVRAEARQYVRSDAAAARISAGY